MHQGTDDLHDLIAGDGEDRGAEEPLRLGVDQDVHEPVGLALQLGPRHGGRRNGRLAHVSSRCAGLLVVHADAPERRVGEHRVRRDATVRRAVPAAQMVGEDLVVLVRGVGEGATSVDVTERPHAVDRGSEHAIGADETAVVGQQSDPVEVEAIGVRCPSDGDQQMRTVDRSAAGEVEAHSSRRRLDPLDRRRRADLDAFGATGTE